MNQTVVGVFDSRAEAQTAADALEARGFAREAIRITDEVDSTVAATETSATERVVPADEPGFLESIGNFFGRLFGSDESRLGHYAEAVRRGHCVVRVDVDDEAASRRAVEALEGAGAVDIDERLSQWHAAAGGAAGGASSPEFTSVSPGLYSPATGDAPGGFDSTPGSSGAASQEAAAASAAGERAAASPVRVYPRGEEPTAEDARYRGDYAQRYAGRDGSYDDYAPAYRYGRRLASNPLHAGRDWAQIEADARRDWEQEQAGAERTDWDDVREAVHYSWRDSTGPA